MGALIDLTGRRFGLLTVEARLPDRTAPSGARQPVWGCICDCGRRTVEEGRALRAARASSCRECVRDPARMLKFAATYIAYWPELYVLKVGRAWRESRIEQLRQSGAEILLYAQGTDGSWEREALAELAERFPRAFDAAGDAVDVLERGSGWSECFLVDHHEVQLAFDLCMSGFVRGNDIGYNPPATAQWRRELDAAQRARRVDAGRVDDSRGDAGDGRAGDDDAARAAGDRVGVVPGRGDDSRGGPPRAARTAARGHREGDDDGRAGRSGVDRPGADVAADVFTGCERGCARERGSEGESAGARAAAAAAAALAARCSSDRLRRSSQRFPLALRTLQDCPAAARAVVDQCSLPGGPRSALRRRSQTLTRSGVPLRPATHRHPVRPPRTRRRNLR